MGDEAAEPASASVRRPCPTVMTIGHSTRPFDAFVELLKEHDVALGIDILRATLPAAGIAYRHLPGLGGLRRATGEDTNIGWHNLSFRGYADYMQTVEFTIALDELIDLAHDVRLVIMCAEAVPWRCHRSLVADALLLRGLDVRHIMGPAKSIVASLTRFAHVDGPMLTYPAQP
jgi:uncharacterized protein (DUF488 family)